MPPNSTHINEEGMAVKSFKLVKNGIFQEEGVAIGCGLYNIFLRSDRIINEPCPVFRL